MLYVSQNTSYVTGLGGSASFIKKDYLFTVSFYPRQRISQPFIPHAMGAISATCFCLHPGTQLMKPLKLSTKKMPNQQEE